MGWLAYHRFSRVSFPLLFLPAYMLLVAGCNNTCITGTLNAPSGSTVAISTGSSPPSCTLSTANGIVQMQIGAPSGSASAPGGSGSLLNHPYVTHLFVTLAGIDAHNSPLATDDTPGWQKLAPQLQAHPVQVDLLADPHSAAFPDAVLPTGAYRQIRLRLASQPPASLVPTSLPWVEPESALETNRCNAGVPHCAVMSDARVWPIALPPSRPDWRITLENAPGRELYVPPDATVALVIELDRDRTWVWPSGESMLFAPVFRVNVHQPFNVSAN